MAESVIFPKPSGASYVIPDVNDENWGQNVTDYLLAIPNGVVPTAGLFTLTGDLSFGSAFGLTVKYLTSITSSAASSGVLRLAHADTMGWRNNGGGGDLLLSVNSSDALLFNGATVLTGASGGYVSSITGTANQVIASGSTGAVTLSLPQNIATTSAVTFGSVVVNGALSLSPTGGNPRLVFDTTGGGVVTLDVPAAASTTFSLHLPSTQGGANSILSNDGSGNLAWSTGSGAFVSSITGTANEIIASGSTGAITLSTPQAIGTGSSPTFANLHFGNSGTIDNAAGILRVNGASGVRLSGNGGGIVADDTILPFATNTSDLGSSALPFKKLYIKFGSVNFAGASSGAVDLGPASAGASYALSLPAAQGSANQTWINDGSGSMSFATLPVAGGGTGATAQTAYAVLCGGTTSTGAYQSIAGLGSSGQVLTSNGAGALPTFQTLSGTGTVNSGTSTHLAYYATSTNAVSDASGATISGTYTYSGAVTSSGGITMSGATIAMGSQKITGLANGSASTDAAAFGQIPVFAAAVQSTLTSPFSTTLSTYQSTGLAASIVPTTSSRRVKITVSGTLRTANGALASAILTIKRGSTDLATGTDGFAHLDIVSSVTQVVPFSITFIDSPATASSVTYTLYLRNDDAVTNVSTPFTNGQDQMILEDIV